MPAHRHILVQHCLVVRVRHAQVQRPSIRQVQLIALLLPHHPFYVHRVPRSIHRPVRVHIRSQISPALALTFPIEHVAVRRHQRRLSALPRQHKKVLRLRTRLCIRLLQDDHSVCASRLLRLPVSVSPNGHCRSRYRRACLPVANINLRLPANHPLHHRNRRHNRHGVRLVRAIRRFNQVNPRIQPIHRQLLRLAHQRRRRHQLPSRHQLALVQQRHLRKL